LYLFLSSVTIFNDYFTLNKELDSQGEIEMAYYVNYGNEKQYFSLPKGWNLISAEDKPPIPELPTR